MLARVTNVLMDVPRWNLRVVVRNFFKSFCRLNHLYHYGDMTNYYVTRRIE